MDGNYFVRGGDWSKAGPFGLFFDGVGEGGSDESGAEESALVGEGEGEEGPAGQLEDVFIGSENVDVVGLFLHFDLEVEF